MSPADLARPLTVAHQPGPGRRHCRRCGRVVSAAVPGACPVSDVVLASLLAWRQREGRSWRVRLATAWMLGQDVGSELLLLRNLVGPSGLRNMDPSPASGDR